VYEPLKRLAAGILRLSLAPPDAPAGDPRSTVVFRASPRYLTYRLIPFWLGVAVEVTSLTGALAGALAAGHTGSAVAVGVVCLVFAAGTFLSYCALRLDYELRYYIVTDRSIRIREGAMLVREMTLTHANVQDLSISQGPLQRLLGIADVVIKTAGGGAAQARPGGHGHLAMFAGVEDAEGIRDRIRGFLRRRDDGGLGDAPDRPRRGPPPPALLAAAGSASPAVLAALREVVEAARALRSVTEQRAGAARACDEQGRPIHAESVLDEPDDGADDGAGGAADAGAVR
jgi:membrane protein YdbS with pleckstrin-like domain